MFHYLFKAFAMVFLLSSLGCVMAQSTPITGPDGAENQLISCSYIKSCYEKASEVCRGPYKIVNTHSATSGSGTDVSTDINLLVKCGR